MISIFFPLVSPIENTNVKSWASIQSSLIRSRRSVRICPPTLFSKSFTAKAATVVDYCVTFYQKVVGGKQRVSDSGHNLGNSVNLSFIHHPHQHTFTNYTDRPADRQKTLWSSAIEISSLPNHLQNNFKKVLPLFLLLFSSLFLSFFFWNSWLTSVWTVGHANKTFAAGRNLGSTTVCLRGWESGWASTSDFWKEDWVKNQTKLTNFKNLAIKFGWNHNFTREMFALKGFWKIVSRWMNKWCEFFPVHGQNPGIFSWWWSK